MRQAGHGKPQRHWFGFRLKLRVDCRSLPAWSPFLLSSKVTVVAAGSYKGGVELSVDGGSLMVQVRDGGVLLMSVSLERELRGGDYLKTQGAEPTSLGECM